MKFGERLKMWRLGKDMSQDEVAVLLDTSKQVISRYETGQRIPKITTVGEYAAKLGVSVEYLLGSEDEENSAPEIESGISNEKLAFIEKIKALDDDVVAALNRLADSIIAQREK